MNNIDKMGLRLQPHDMNSPGASPRAPTATHVAVAIINATMSAEVRASAAV